MSDNRWVVPTNGGSPDALVSIIVPCYNCRKFLAESIESALAQSHANIEVIVVDDGSTDGTSAIAQSYPVRFIQGTHRGVSAARNLGIRASVGEFLLFLDSDDRLPPDAVAAGLAALQQNPNCGMAVGAHNLITQSGEWIATRQKPIPIRDGYQLLLRSNFIECTSSVILRRACFPESIFFRPSLNGAEDYDLYLRLAQLSPVCSHSQVVSEYRLHSSNASRNSRMMLSHTLAVISEQRPFALKSMRYFMAYLYGSLFWRRKYGRQLTVEMAMSDFELPPHEGISAWSLLARSYPLGIPVVLISRMLPKSLVRSLFRRNEVNSPCHESATSATH